MLSMGYKKTAKVDLRKPAQSTQFACYICQRDTECSLSKVNKGRGVDCVTMKSCPECDFFLFNCKFHVAAPNDKKYDVTSAFSVTNCI